VSFNIMAALFAVNICVLPPAEIAAAAARLGAAIAKPSTAMCKAGAAYRVEPGASGRVVPCGGDASPGARGMLLGLPHVTLCQGYCPADLQVLRHAQQRMNEAAEAICKDGSCTMEMTSRIDKGPVFAKFKDEEAGGEEREGHVPGIALDMTPALKRRHEAACATRKEVCVKLSAEEKKDQARLAVAFVDYAHGNETSTDYAATFLDEKAYDKYGPHLTLGAAPPDAPEGHKYDGPMTTKLTEWRVVVARMGNFCSCCEPVEPVE
jgi:hypothetical protein